MKAKYLYWIGGALAVIYFANRFFGQSLPFDFFGALTGTSAVDANQNKYAGDTLGGVGPDAGRPTMQVNEVASATGVQS